ncbi:MAG: MTH938/NDUFAF3 family protein [Candidatus Heimdallarchaeaceae archaeon]
MNLITKYSFGRMIVNEMKYNKDLIVFPDEIKTNWWRKEGHKLCLEDLSILKEKQPEILILGTGSLGLMKVPDEVIEKLKEMGIDARSSGKIQRDSTARKKSSRGFPFNMLIEKKRKTKKPMRVEFFDKA